MKRTPRRKPLSGRKSLGTPLTHADRVSEAKLALDQAHEDYLEAVLSGNATAIRTARRELMIALANYLALTGGESTESESESTSE